MANEKGALSSGSGSAIMTHLTEEEARWMADYRAMLAERFPGIVDDILVFGSKARGDAVSDSDLDILLIIREGDWRQKDAITGPGYISSIGTSVVPSFMVLTRAEWESHERKKAPFWQTVTRDGVSVR